MTDQTEPEVVATLEDDEGLRIVDILRHDDSHFTYAEYHRTDGEGDDWQLVEDDAAKTYNTQFAAYTAATRNVEWLMD
ncbi:hypothetical protein [Octadecabacter ascidiaceicola]|uniref:Uncharacterized protein n=1 Tax=Octadecabacter ascidiaceicola TaxID=1655543 RepID=A0A238K619_9RHOB|nr:hypothetical protein [Octadecabacter ascidiaceicola]SMX37386.1 hypothetical protein OCA8868_01424 [Octadecabacter ascidiaceicola]